MCAKMVQHPDISAEYVEYRRKKWFLNVENITRWFIKPTQFIYLGGKPTKQSIILSNHEGTSAPLALELYSGLPIRFWGAAEMNKNFKTAYYYQTQVYYHGKKHWNLHLARLFCLLATPLTRMFYIGLDLLSTYKDVRFKTTLKQSLEVMAQEHTLVIFPENSEKGYLKELEGFHQGALMLFEQCLRKGYDVPVYVAYYKKDTKQYIVDAPRQISQLLGQELSRAELAQQLCDRCNELGRMEIEKERAAI